MEAEVSKYRRMYTELARENDAIKALIGKKALRPPWCRGATNKHGTPDRVPVHVWIGTIAPRKTT